LVRDKNSRIFLDVNPKCFQKILSYHQLCKIASPESLPDLPTMPDDMQYIMEKQLDFFGLAGGGTLPLVEKRATNARKGNKMTKTLSGSKRAHTGVETNDDIDSHLSSWRAAIIAERNAYAAALETQSTLEQQLDDEEAFIKYFSSGETADVVDLDVSGKCMTVKRSTLMACEGSMLASKFSTLWKQDDDGDGGVLIEHGAYSFGKIIDQLRLKRMFPVEADALQPPKLVAHERDNFKRVVKYYFPGQEYFILGDAKKFVFTSPDDTNGVLHYLGTKQGTADWQNPHVLQEVVCSSSGGHAGDVKAVCAHRVQNDNNRESCGWCDNGLNKSVTCDLKTVQVRLEGYSLGNIRDCFAPCNWKFEGSNDGDTYEVLHTAVNNRAIPGVFDNNIRGSAHFVAKSTLLPRGFPSALAPASTLTAWSSTAT
jgi:hypothetical protein